MYKDGRLSLLHRKTTKERRGIVIKERDLGIDLTKSVAMVLVIILHVNGYLVDTFPAISSQEGTGLLWHVLEAVSYPAIHLFVMSSAYFLVDSEQWLLSKKCYQYGFLRF